MFPSSPSGYETFLALLLTHQSVVWFFFLFVQLSEVGVWNEDGVGWGKKRKGEDLECLETQPNGVSSGGRNDKTLWMTATVQIGTMLSLKTGVLSRLNLFSYCFKKWQWGWGW